MKNKKCKRCGNIFTTNYPNHQYCGSKKNKVGCSWQNIKEKHAITDKVNKLKYRQNKTDYYHRQEKLKQDRVKRKKNVFGDHTNEEWIDLKNRFNNCCCVCGLSEKELRIKYSKLKTLITKDHIVPISMGGTDNISNIRPVCSGCNSKKNNKKDGNKWVVASGYFNPVHSGHINMLKEAAQLGKLIVVINNDKQVELKGSLPFLDEKERAYIISSLKFVSGVFISIDFDRSILRSLQKIKPDIFVNGGDVNEENCRELDFCNKNGIQAIFGVGGSSKVQSSSSIKQKIIDNLEKQIKYNYL